MPSASFPPERAEDTGGSPVRGDPGDTVSQGQGPVRAGESGAGEDGILRQALQKGFDLHGAGRDQDSAVGGVEGPVAVAVPGVDDRRHRDFAAQQRKGQGFESIHSYDRQSQGQCHGIAVADADADPREGAGAHVHRNGGQVGGGKARFRQQLVHRRHDGLLMPQGAVDPHLPAAAVRQQSHRGHFIRSLQSKYGHRFFTSPSYTSPWGRSRTMRSSAPLPTISMSSRSRGRAPVTRSAHSMRIRPLRSR